MCASRCGYPHPRKVTLAREHPGMLSASEFRSRKKMTHPIMSGLMKSSVTIFQPIIQPNADGSITTLTRDDIDYYLRHAWPGRNGLGSLYRQFPHETVEIQFPHETVEIGSEYPPLEFDSITLAEARRGVDLASQAYGLQNEASAGTPQSMTTGLITKGKA
jgi:hypothetical protein